MSCIVSAEFIFRRIHLPTFGCICYRDIIGKYLSKMVCYVRDCRGPCVLELYLELYELNLDTG